METKNCTQCHEDKTLDNFYRDKRRSKPNARCKECQSNYERTRYRENEDCRKRHLATSKAYQLGQRQDFQIRILTIMKQRGCIDCGETDPIVLDFDHVRGEKTAGVSVMLRNHRSWELIETEITKCDVRCANCHRRKTAKERHWYSTINLDSL